MKPYIIYMALLALLFVACTKEKNTNTIEVPWRFTLTDGSINTPYSFFAQTYGPGYFSNISYFNCIGGSDSITRFDMSADATGFLSNSRTINIGIGITSFSDTIKSRKLAKGSPLATKQITLKEIFIPGRILKTSGNLLQEPLIFNCSYQSESGQSFNTNYLNLFTTDYVKIISSEIWNDDSGIAKIKVSLEYSCHVQGFIANVAWLTEVRTVTGTMQTFFTVQ